MMPVLAADADGAMYRAREFDSGANHGEWCYLHKGRIFGCHRASWDKSERPLSDEFSGKKKSRTRLVSDARHPGRRSRRTIRGLGMMYHSHDVGKGEPFKLKSIRTERSPAGAEGVGWHRYIITQGGNTIVGHRQGSTRSVALAVEEIVLQLNERRAGHFSRAIRSPLPTPSRRRPT